MKQTHRVTAGVGVVVLGWLAGCAGGPAGPVGEATPAPWTPLADDQAVGPRPASLPQPCDLTQEGAVCRGVAGATVFDTRLVVPQVQEPDAAVLRRIRDVVPPHQTPRTLEEGEPNALVAGGVLDEGRVEIVRTWPSISATGWNPPDPTLAVGPDHVVATVNMQIAFYSKAGVQQFSLPLNDTGNPGFFETVGARGFTFDPKCFYDHGAGRFVVMAPEVYSGTQEAYICIAVSDDSDPNGVWYKYRTDAVLNVNGINYWWDYPGFGFDGQAYYVTSNLFAMTSGPFGGVGFRIFDKAAMLAGAPASYSTLRDGSAGSVQVAQHFGTPIAPYFVSTGSSTSLRVRAITNPLTAPAIVTATVSVPAYSGPTSAPTSAGGLSTVDSRIMNAQWRNGNLYACHTILSGGRNVARWYHMSTGTWPTSGGVSLLQSGNVAGGGTLHAFFPAIYSNAAGDVGMVFGTSSIESLPAVAVTGRRAFDPPNVMGAPEVVKPGEASATGRWGDYFDLAIDPADDTTFWAIGEYARSTGWNNWITSFIVADDPAAHAMPDDAGSTTAGVARVVDVLANDWHSGGQALVIDSFQAASVRGGAITRSVGTGPGGRDQLRYVPPMGFNGFDSFTYTVRDTSGSTNSTFVGAFTTDPATFRVPENPSNAQAGVNVSYYVLQGPTAVPDFSALTPYLRTSLSRIDIGSSANAFATSGRAGDVGAVFEGFINVPTSGYYTLAVTSDDGSRLYLGDTLLINNDGVHGMREAWAAAGLQSGRHRVRVEFFQGGGNNGLIVSMGAYTGLRSTVQDSQWFRVVCDPDANADGNVDQDDVSYLVNVVGGGPNPSGMDPDFNGDGNVDQDDVQALINVVAGGPCP
jgi:hypothetical protein